MSDDTLDSASERVRPRFRRPRGKGAQNAGHALLAAGSRALDAKAGAASNRVLRVARGSFAASPKAALRRAVANALRGSAKRAHHARGAGIRAAAKYAQRVVVKARVVLVRHNSPDKAIRQHLAYMARDPASRDGQTGRLFNEVGDLDARDVGAFAERGLSCRHQFRFIVSPERGGDLDLERFTRNLMRSMERDLGTRLDYAAAVHHDTDQPHVHIVVNGHDARGGDLVISRDYIANGMRHRAMELATDALGYRSDLDILQSLARDVHADRFTALDRRLQKASECNPDRTIDLRLTPGEPRAAMQRRLNLGRLEHLGRMGLASEVVSGVWRLEPHALDRLRGFTQHRAVQRLVEKHLNASDHNGSIEIVDKAKLRVPITGRVLGRGLANELSDAAYIVVAGIDGKTYYAALSSHSERHLAEPARAGDIVTLSGVESRPTGRADRTIVEQAAGNRGLYDAQRHLESIRGQRLPFGAAPERYVEAHVRRCDALVSRGFLARESEGRYRVPSDLLERLTVDPARARDSAFITVEVQGRDLRAQVAARVFTWLDEQLVTGAPQSLRQSAVRTRFQDDLIEAAERRTCQLVQLGLARIDADGVQFDSQLRSKLMRIEHEDAVRRLSQTYGRYVELAQTQRFAGRVAATETLVSGAHAVVVSGDRFTLVPAEHDLAKLVGRDVSLSLASGRDAEQTRVRFRVLDAMDLSPSLGR
jgi:type IV secretory pathway VirD2 relaxase